MLPTKSFSEILHEWAEAFMHRSFRDFKRVMDESGLSPSQINGLMRLYYRGACGVSDIGEHLSISNAAASQMVERLVQLGLLVRTESQEDRRVKQLTLTEEGRSLVERAVAARRGWLEELTCTLTPEQQEKIAAALVILTDAAHNLQNGEK